MHLGTIRSQNQGGGVKTVFVARGTTLPIKKIGRRGEGKNRGEEAFPHIPRKQESD